MKDARSVTLCALLVLQAARTLAIQPGTDVVVPAAARGPGAANSLWVTDLYIYNPGFQEEQFTVEWLVRNRENSGANKFSDSVAANGVAIFEDVVRTKFGLESGGGALRIMAHNPVVVVAAILNRASGQEFGQAAEGVPVSGSVGAGKATAIVGLKNDARYRSNIFLVESGGTGAVVKVRVVDGSGQEQANRTFNLKAWEPRLEAVSSLGGSSFSDGIAYIEVLSGSVITGASRVNSATGDPLTLNYWWSAASGN